MKSRNRGITLVALIITIVVLLILAAVTIKGISGEEIVDKAQETKEGVENIQIEEEIRFAVLKLQNIEGTVEDKEQWIKNELPGAIVTENEKYTIIDYKNKEVALDNNFNIKYIFDAKEWDKLASEDLFEWGSNDSSSPDYGKVIGYKKEVRNNNITTLRYPSRCTKIMYAWNENGGRYANVVEKIEIPPTVIEFEGTAFGGSSNATVAFSALKEVVIEEGVQNLGSGMFARNKSIETIILPTSIEVIPNSIFYGCINLKNIIIPNSVTEIGSNAFYECTSLERLTIPNSVTKLGSTVFYGCSSLNSIIIPQSVISAGNSLFTGWQETQTVYVSFSEGERPSGWSSSWKTNGSPKIEYDYTGE